MRKFKLEVFVSSPMFSTEAGEVLKFNTREQALAYLETRTEDSEWALLTDPSGGEEMLFNATTFDADFYTEQ